MTLCTAPGCQTTAGCRCQPSTFMSPALPRFLPVNLPFPMWGRFTVAVMDEDGNVVIKTNQPDTPFNPPDTP